MKTINTSFFIILFVFLFTHCKKEKTVQAPETENPATKTIHVSVVAKNLKLPWGLAYLPDGSLLFTEREGNLNLLKAGESTHTTLTHRSVNTASEGGLLSIAVDPAYASNHFIYIFTKPLAPAITAWFS